MRGDWTDRGNHAGAVEQTDRDVTADARKASA